MPGFFLTVLFSEHINTAQASQLCLALLAISFIHIKCNFSTRKWELIMGYIVLYICFLKVPVGAKPESFGENIIVYLGKGCGRTHIAVLFIHELGRLKRKPQKNICVFFVPTVVLFLLVSYYLSCWFCNLIFSFEFYLRMSQFFIRNIAQ